MKARLSLNNAIDFSNKFPLAILFLFFALSVVVRLPNLNRPLSKHHELNPALVLINSEEWDRKTPQFYHYIPVHSYHFPGDQILDKSNDLAHGYVVNTTFGALWYIMPYGFFHLVGAAPSPLSLQVFNILLQLITVILIFRLAKHLFKSDKDASLKALIACIIYLFSPSPLWFHGNGYVHEIAVLPFIFAACLTYLRILESQKTSAFQYLLLTFLIIAGILCDWLMCFVAAAMFATSFYNWIKVKDAKQIKILCCTTLAVIAAISIIFFKSAHLWVLIIIGKL